MSSQFSIRELSQEFAVTPRTLRFYEEKGLLTPVRSGHNRIYSAADRARLILVLRGKTLGLTLDQSAELISMYDPESDNKKQLELLIEKINARKDQLIAQKGELERMIVDLEQWEQRSRAALLGRIGRKSSAVSGKRASGKRVTGKKVAGRRVTGNGARPKKRAD